MAGLLSAGIRAVKNRDLETGRALLMQVVERDEHNEQAWLWLSGAVESDEDRRICLENVLAINPNHAAAQRGLAKLGPAPDEPKAEAGLREHVVRREVAPVSLAQALLHPEAQIKEWRWSDPTAYTPQVAAVETRAHSAFDDVWNSQSVICAYCAQEVAPEDRQCPRCQRDLIESQLRYREPSHNLYYLGMLTLSLGLQFFLQFAVDLSLEAQLPVLILEGGFTLALLACAFGVYTRQRWGYFGAMGFSGLALFASLARIAARPTAENEIVALIVSVLPAAQIVTALLAVLLGILRAGRDFELAEARQVMRLGETLLLSGDFYHTGKAYADRGMWAMAVPYWQRAAANDPNRPFFQVALGEAYARLGFYERSLDVLEGALRITLDPEAKSEIEHMMQVVKQRIASRSG